jgi:hypothetical protein
MRARVKSDFRWRTVIAFGGHEFVKDEYRSVPSGCEEAAKLHPFLEVEPETVKQSRRKNKVAEPEAEVDDETDRTD